MDEKNGTLNTPAAILHHGRNCVNPAALCNKADMEIICRDGMNIGGLRENMKSETRITSTRERASMRSDLDCLVCMMQQAVNTVRLATGDMKMQREVLAHVAEAARDADLGLTPAALSQKVYKIISGRTGVQDPYLDIKRRTNQEALRLLPGLRDRIRESEDPLSTALHLAVAGNVIDLGIGHAYDLNQDVQKMAHTPFAIDHSGRLRKKLQKGKRVLYLGDNSGEIVFDRLLVEELLKTGAEITFAVKSAPIINDAMMEDAVTAGLTEWVPVIETGAGDIGLDFRNVSAEFMHVFQEAELILAKGHGHFETCNTVRAPFYFLLKAKCAVVARELGVRKGDIVFLEGGGRGAPVRGRPR